MKVFKELPPSLYHSLRLSLIPISKLLSRRKEQLPVVVSLTSIPSRIKTLHLVIRSLFDQSHHPKKIVLWLNEEIRGHIPYKLDKLQGDLFEICFSEQKSSHRKLVHSLLKYPDDIIVTCDDDLIYRKDWLYLIYKCHQKFPDHIIGNRTIHINYDEQGQTLPFSQWKYQQNGVINDMAIVPIGAWGILYPVKSLSEKVTDSELYMKLAAHGDDLWFKAMAVLNKTRAIQAEMCPKEPIPIIGTQLISLKKLNLGQKLNDVQWKSLSDYFKLDSLIRPENDARQKASSEKGVDSQSKS